MHHVCMYVRRVYVVCMYVCTYAYRFWFGQQISDYLRGRPSTKRLGQTIYGSFPPDDLEVLEQIDLSIDK